MPDHHRPRGFMTLGTAADETILIRVTEVASVREVLRGGALLTLNSGQQMIVKETLGEVATLMHENSRA